MISEIQLELYLSQHVKLPNFNQNYNRPTNFSETPQYQIMAIHKVL
jgi:hypothetical protein